MPAPRSSAPILAGTTAPWIAASLAGMHWLLLPPYDVADLLHRAKQLAEVLRGGWAAGGCGGADLQLSEVALQLVDGLTEGELVPHLLDGVHVAHTECVQVLASLQHGAVAGHLL